MAGRNLGYILLFIAGFFKISHGASYVSFHLYRRTEPNGVALPNDALPANFDQKNPTYVLLHGVAGHYQDICVKNIAKALLETRDANVIVPNYTWAAYGYTMLYQEIASQISRFLLQNKVNPSETVVMGQSLGAQIAGVLYTKGFKPEEILGLDPAGPQFGGIPATAKLSPLSANAVQAVHTDVGSLGSSTLDANLDVYINRGTRFPCCSTNVCSHIGACDWIAETIRRGPSVASSCNSLYEALSGTCRGPAVYSGFGVTPRSGMAKNIAHLSLSQCVARR